MKPSFVALAKQSRGTSKLLVGRGNRAFCKKAPQAQEAQPKYPALHASAKFTNSLEPYYPDGIIPIYRVIDENGKVVNPEWKNKVSNEEWLKIYKTMVLAHNIDSVLYDGQRQGRISFYMTNFGEYAAQVASAAALRDDDQIMMQYREMGCVLWRGFSVQQICDNCYGNKDDCNKGRSMPVHYGSKELNLHTISSCLTTQVPQASGVGYALKREGKGACCICYFGEGAASEGDAHAGFSFAGALQCQTIFFCRNNSFAISTPTHEQYTGDGIASRAAGYGMPAFRVDGNDMFAVHEVTSKAREISVTEQRPVMIEAMTYRGGHHSTSDDSTRYRPKDEIEYWEKVDNPISRARSWLIENGIWTQKEDEELKQDSRSEVLKAFLKAEKKQLGPVRYLFEDVYKELPPHLARQQANLQQHVASYYDKYPVNHDRG